MRERCKLKKLKQYIYCVVIFSKATSSLFECCFLSIMFSHCKIAIYLWLGSIGNTTEFQFAFHSKIRWNSIFSTNCRQIILIFFLRNGSKGSLFHNCYQVSSHDILSVKQGTEGVVWWDQTMAVKETTISVAQMHFIFAKKYLDIWPER